MIPIRTYSKSTDPATNHYDKGNCVRAKHAPINMSRHKHIKAQDKQDFACYFKCYSASKKKKENRKNWNYFTPLLYFYLFTLWFCICLFVKSYFKDSVIVCGFHSLDICVLRQLYGFMVFSLGVIRYNFN
jgi:hypothetical protein